MRFLDRRDHLSPALFIDDDGSNGVSLRTSRRALGMVPVVRFGVLSTLRPPTPGADPQGIARAFNEIIRQKYAFDPELRVVPGREVPLGLPGSALVGSRLEDAFVGFKAGDDLSRIARLLAGLKGSARDMTRRIVAINGEPPDDLKNYPPISLKELGPAVVKRHTGTWSNNADQANCWNAVLNWHFPQTGVGHSVFSETDLRSKFARVPEGSKVGYQDVVVLRDCAKADMLLHAAVLITDSVVWEKASSDREYPTTFQTMVGMLQPYSPEISRGELAFEIWRRK